MVSEFHTQASPDYIAFKERLFGVDEARKLRETAIRKAFKDKKIFFIAPEKITLEAQNALLKTFEEPIPDTQFFLSLRDEGAILSTLRSRMQVLRLDDEVGENEGAKKFLKMALKDRLNFVKKFVEKEENLPAFLDELLISIKETGDFVKLDKLYKARLLSADRGAAPRLILEHLSLVL